MRDPRGERACYPESPTGDHTRLEDFQTGSVIDGPGCPVTPTTVHSRSSNGENGDPDRRDLNVPAKEALNRHAFTALMSLSFQAWNERFNQICFISIYARDSRVFPGSHALGYPRQ
jgi:hypothetical protein